jgi:hypothetical protein
MTRKNENENENEEWTMNMKKLCMKLNACRRWTRRFSRTKRAFGMHRLAGLPAG